MILQPFPAKFADSKSYTIRWQMYSDYLNKHGDDYSQVLTTDIRDVIFQGDIFKEFAGIDNYMGYALEGETVGGRKTGLTTNYEWVTVSFGKDVADKLADKEIICAGTIIGTTAEMKVLCAKMVEYMPKVNGGHDQPTYQYLFYNNLLPFKKLIPIDCITGAILTSGVFHLLNPIEFRDEFILRGDGNVPAVVHQYPTHPKTAEFVDRIWHAKDFQIDKRFIDSKSATEQLYMLAKCDKFDDALKFLAEYSLGKSDFIRRDFFRRGDMLIEILLMMVAKKPTAEIEALAVIIQYATINSFSESINLKQINKLCLYVDASAKAGRTVVTAFKNFVANYLHEAAKMSVQNNNLTQAVSFIDAARSLDVPITPEFYQLQSEIYRRLGDKTKALEAYKKFLDIK